VDFYGVGLSKNMTIPFKTGISKQGYSYEESVQFCNTSLPVPVWAKDCIRGRMGYNNPEFSLLESQKINECGATGLCLKQWRKVETSYEILNINLTNVELISLVNGINKTYERICDFGQPCYDSSRRYWHDNSDGKYKMRLGSGSLKIGDQINTFLKIFGKSNFVMDGKSYEVDFGDVGWQSSKSNTVLVPEQLNISDVVVDPLGDPSCIGVYLSSPYGFRTFDGVAEMHEGIDFARDPGCKIQSIYKGNAVSKWYAGNTIEIKHDEKYSTLYGHAEYVIGEYPRKVESDEDIMFMGCTGRCSGTHVHFEIHEFGEHRNPMNYFESIFDKYIK
jgi:murein DD-endopeptidase MepM/ murein hydrolase activator NlpD